MTSALAPVFAAILLGYALSRFHFPGDDFWPHAERITYYLLFPALLINKLASAHMGSEMLPLACAILGGDMLVSIGMLAARKRLGVDGPAFSSMFQGSVRVNTYVGLAGAVALLGDPGIALSAVALLCIVALNNVLCVLVVARYGSASESGGLDLVLQVARNPLIIGCIIGFGINLLALPLPGAFHETMAVLGRAALPLGLLAVGAGLRLGGVLKQMRPLSITTVVKLAVLPTITALLCHLFGAGGDALTVAVLFSALPTASSSFILSRQLGGDTELMASLITFQTLVSALTIPIAMTTLT